MKNRSRFLLVTAGGLTALAVAIGWFLAHRPLPSGGQPVAPVEASPHQDVSHPRPEAAQASPVVKSTTEAPAVQKTIGGHQQSDLLADFRHTQECISAYRQALTLRNQQDVCKEADAAQNPMCASASLSAIDARLAEQFRAAATCGEDISALEVAYYRKTVDLAARGDPDAQLCFVQSKFQIGRPWSGDEISFYKANAPMYLQNGLEHGDWRAVVLLATPQRVLSHSRSLMGFIVPHSQLEQFKLNRLLRLGATDGYAEQLDAVAFDPELPLSAEDQKSAEDWARKEYDKYFRNSPTLRGAPQACLATG